MKLHYEAHAGEVVNNFKKTLSDEQVEALGEDSLNDLLTLIEAALGVIDSQAKHAAAKTVEQLASELRKEAGRAGD